MLTASIKLENGQGLADVALLPSSIIVPQPTSSA